MARKKKNEIAAGAQEDDFDVQDLGNDDLEGYGSELTFTFPPIFYQKNVGDAIKFIPMDIIDGIRNKNSQTISKLIQGRLVAYKGEFKLSGEPVKVQKGDVICIGLSPTIQGDKKIGTSDGDLGELGKYCAEHGTPILLIYEGKKRSTENKSQVYHSWKIRVPDEVIQAIK